MDSSAQTIIDDPSGLINQSNSILIQNADGWMVSVERPDDIADGFNLLNGIPIHSLHLDSLKAVLGAGRYGWAEVAFYVDSTLQSQPRAMRNIGY
ncbi:MAG: hypothetical protein LAT57_10255 [Balneolales bacterium]|nr:hypothetical protein [Balneolales bacterium]